MSFAQRVSATFNKQMDNIKAVHDRRVAEAEVRAKRKMADAKTKVEREKAKLVLEREKLALKKELYEAQIATRKAKVAVKQARLEAGDLTIGERAGIASRRLGRSASSSLGSAYRALEKQSRQPARKRAAPRKTITKKKR